VRALLAVRGEEEEAGVVFEGEEFEGGGVFEGVDGVFLGEADGVRAFEGVQVGEEGGEEGGGAGVAQEEHGLGVFGYEGFAGGEGAGGACGFGFAWGRGGLV